MFQNRVLMRLIPDYFSLSEKEQREKIFDVFNNNRKEAYKVFDSEISSSVFKREVTYNELSSKPSIDFDIYNIEFIKLKGFGKSKIHCWGRRYDLDFSHFSNLYDYDKAFEEDQFKLEMELSINQNNHARAEEFANATYSFRLRFENYMKLGREGLLESLSIVSGIEYVMNELASTAIAISNDLYPYTVRHLKDGESPSGILGMRGKVRDYAGKEEFSSELIRFGVSLVRKPEFKDLVTKEFESLDKGVVITSDEKGLFDTPKSYTKSIVVLNSETAKNIGFEDIDSDLEKLYVSNDKLNSLMEKFSDILSKEMHAHYEHLEKHFDPEKIKPLKKTEVVYTDSFIKSLNELSESLTNNGEDND